MIILPGRLTVGHQTLNLIILVQIEAGQLEKNENFNNLRFRSPQKLGKSGESDRIPAGQYKPHMIERRVIEPDEVLSPEVVSDRDTEAGVMAGCPGYGWLSEPSPPNWPPKKGLVHILKMFLSEVAFAVGHFHAYKAFKEVERQCHNQRNLK